MSVLVVLLYVALVNVAVLSVWWVFTPDPEPAPFVESDAAYGLRIASSGYHAGSRS